MQFYSIIYVQKGSVSLINVNFINIYTYYKGNAILAFGEGNSFSYQGGTVELINNGYEIMNRNNFPGFMLIEGFNSVLLTDITFQYNIIGISNSPLIKLYQNDIIHLENLIFTCNYILASEVILIDQTNLIMPINISATYQIATNIYIYNNSFFNNTSISLITITMNQDCQNINIDNNIFNTNIGSRNLLQLTYTNFLPFICIYGVNITTNLIRNQTIYIPPRSINITNSIFINNYQNTLININNLANLYLYNLSLNNNGNYLDSNTITTTKIAEYPNAYLSLNASLQ